MACVDEHPFPSEYGLCSGLPCRSAVVICMRQLYLLSVLAPLLGTQTQN